MTIRIGTFCKVDERICKKFSDLAGGCKVYNDKGIKLYERLGGCPSNTIPSEIQAEENRKKKELERNRFKPTKRR